MPSKTIRSAILANLAKNPSSTVLRLSQDLGVTKADIRYHLQSLLEQGLITSNSQTPPDGRGRPSACYSLTAEARPDNLVFLLDNILKVFQNKPELSVEIWRAIVDTFTIQLKESATSLTLKLQQTIRFLSQQAYAAHWEAGKQGPVVFFNNCPYQKIIANHPELCQMDRLVLSKLTGKEIMLEKNLFSESNPEMVCRFRLLP